MTTDDTAAADTAGSSGWSLYDGCRTSITIPYTTTGARTAPPQIALSVDGSAPHPFTIDTGSLGLVVPAAAVPNLDLSHGTPGQIGYGSSGYDFTGVWVDTTITLKDSDGHAYDETLPVLVVQHSSKGGVPDPGYGGPYQLGVGFGTPTADRDGVPLTVANNAFLNLPGELDQTMRPGYVLGSNDLQIGLTAADAGSGWAYSELSPRTGATAASGGASDWQRASSVISVDGGTPTSGTELVDTGLTQAQVGYPGAPAGGTMLPDGTSFRTDLLGIGDFSTSYTYALGDGNPQTPTGAVADGQSGYVNTTDRLLNGLDYLYDAEGGWIGFRPNAELGNPGSKFSQEIALGGTMRLTAPFSTDLAVVLRDPATISSAGPVVFEAGIGGSAALTLTGGGLFVLGAPGTATGGITLDGARLALDAPGAAGAGPIATEAGTSNLVTTGAAAADIEGLGDDTVFAGGGTVSVRGGSSLAFVGGAGAATVDGAAGSSEIFGATAGGLYHGGSAGKNTLISRSAGSTLTGGGAGDRLFADGHDTLGAAAGGETLVGASGSSLIGADGAALFADGSTSFGTAQGRDTVVSGGPSDTVVGRGGADAVFGGAGKQTVWTGSGAMTVSGGSGGGTVALGSGTALVFAGSGAQTLDVIDGHAGGHALLVGFEAGRDRVVTSGYAPDTLRLGSSGGSATLSLPDGSSITFQGLDPASPDLARLVTAT